MHSKITAQTVTRQKLEVLEETPVRIGIQLGEFALSLAQLLDIAPGAEFEVEIPETTPLVLTMDGTPIASARVLSENGALYLQIEKVFLDAETS